MNPPHTARQNSRQPSSPPVSDSKSFFDLQSTKHLTAGYGHRQESKIKKTGKGMRGTSDAWGRSPDAGGERRQIRICSFSRGFGAFFVVFFKSCLVDCKGVSFSLKKKKKKPHLVPSRWYFSIKCVLFSWIGFLFEKLLSQWEVK